MTAERLRPLYEQARESHSDEALRAGAAKAVHLFYIAARELRVSKEQLADRLFALACADTTSDATAVGMYGVALYYFLSEEEGD